MMQFKAMQNTAYTDASACAPATRSASCAAAACAGMENLLHLDTAILAVSFFIIFLVLGVSICFGILGLRGLLVRLVLAWFLVGLMIITKLHTAAKSNTREYLFEAA